MARDKILSAKFAGKCAGCGERFEQGERVKWNKWDKARHLTCEARPQAPARPREIRDVTLTARFGGKCSSCGGGIKKGETIRWNAETKGRHEACADTRAAVKHEIPKWSEHELENLRAGRCPDGCCGPGADMPATA